MDENEFKKFREWITLHGLLHGLKANLRVLKERRANTEYERKKYLYARSIKRLEREIAGVRKCLEEYE
ncbi:hypothetical protein [Shouchella tritolerans]|uniref:hypothetical protein n=1 Tax=Shouchella tritolerans TaxID=2979466 RepID=UPI0021E8D6E9|nr:hypothetical protein [Shouchella tritolerans]